MLKKGLVAKVLEKKKYFFLLIKQKAKSSALWRSNSMQVIFSTLPGKLHIVAEMVLKVQREEFWRLFRIMSEEQNTVFADIR